MHSLLSGLWSLLTSALSFRKEPASGSALPSLPSGSLPGSSISQLSTSQSGQSLIKHYEGCRLTAYQDLVGIWTIGYGDTENVQAGMVITQEEAESRLARRLAKEFEPAVRKVIAAPIEQCEFDAMVSLAYNVGVTAFSKSTLVKFFNAGDTAQAADQFPRWDKAGGKSVKGLRRRRAAERARFMGLTAEQAIAIGDATS